MTQASRLSTTRNTLKSIQLNRRIATLKDLDNLPNDTVISAYSTESDFFENFGVTLIKKSGRVHSFSIEKENCSTSFFLLEHVLHLYRLLLVKDDCIEVV